MAKVYLDKPYVKLFWDQKKNILTNTWTGFCTYDEIIAVGERIMDAVEIESATKVLYDARGLEVLDERSQMYVAGKFTKDIIQAGVRVAATVLPQDVFAQFTVSDIQQSLSEERETVVNYFNTLDDALDWLKVK